MVNINLPKLNIPRQTVGTKITGQCKWPR